MQTDAPAFPRLPSWKALLCVVAGFFAVTGILYGHSLGSDFVRWDDGMLVYENPAIREISPASLQHIFSTYDPELYIPLTFFTYQLDFQIGGQNPFIYHFDNFVLHTLNALFVAWLVFLIARRKWLALACGLLFAVHPLHTEAVEWVSARKDVLSSFFFLGTLISYLYWRERGGKTIYLLSLALFTLGLLSKVMVITLPVVLFLLDWREGRRWSMALLTEKVPYLLLAGIFGVIGVFGKTGVLHSSTLGSKVLMACKSAVFYLQQMVLPWHFSLLYPYTKPITLASPDFLLPIGVLLVIACLLLWQRRWRDLPFGIAFYLVTVAPTFLNFAKGGEMDVYFASDRYAYIPSIGIFYVLLCLLWRITGADRTEEDGRLDTMQRTALGVSAVVVVFCGAVAFRQSFVWRNTETLFQNVIRYYPESSYVAHNNIGNVYRLQGQNAKAIAEYQAALKIRPQAKTYSNLGSAYRKTGQTDLAMQQFEKALALDPESKEAHFGLGIIYADAPETYAKAEAEYRRAVAIDPQYEEAYTNLGSLQFAEGKTDEAVASYRKALGINPYFVEAHYNLAVALSEKKDVDGAITEYQQVARLAPAFIPAHLNLGLLLYNRGDHDAGRAQFEAVLRIDPANKTARSALAQMDAASAGQ